MPIDFIYPDYEVVRNYDRCVGCRVCERQCANEAHYFDEAGRKNDGGRVRASMPPVRFSRPLTRALKIVKNRPFAMLGYSVSTRLASQLLWREPALY